METDDSIKFIKVIIPIHYINNYINLNKKEVKYF